MKMSKSVKIYFLALGLVTILLIMVSGLYIWFTNKTQLSTLVHIPDLDWSRRTQIITDTHSSLFEAITDKSGVAHLVWADVDKPNDKVYVKYGTAQEGQPVEPRLLGTYKRVGGITLLDRGDELHMYWAGQLDSVEQAELDLIRTRLDWSGRIISQETLRKRAFLHIQQMRLVKSVTGTLSLAWIDVVDDDRLISEDYYQVKLQKLDDAGLLNGDPVQLTFTTVGCSQYNLMEDARGEYHLAWIEKFYITEFGVKEEERYDYRLCYQRFNNSGTPVGSKQIIGTVPRAPISVAATKDKVFFAWLNLVKDDWVEENSLNMVEVSIPNTMIFGASIDLRDVEKEIEVLPLTTQRGPSLNQTLVVDHNGEIHLVYVDEDREEVSLTHQTFMGDLRRPKKEFKRLYPDYRMAFGLDMLNGKYPMPLVFDQNNHGHLFWSDFDSNGRHIYYANSVNPTKPSAFEIIGLSEYNRLESWVLSLGYVIAMPLVFFLLFQHLLFLFLITVLVIGVYYLLKSMFPQSRIHDFLTNGYVAPALICVIHFLLYFFSQKAYLFVAPFNPSFGTTCFIYAAATIGALIFARLNPFKKNLVLAGVTAGLWVCWINLISQMFLLSTVNLA